MRAKKHRREAVLEAMSQEKRAERTSWKLLRNIYSLHFMSRVAEPWTDFQGMPGVFEALARTACVDACACVLLQGSSSSVSPAR